MISQNSECKIYEPLVSVMLDDELTQTEQERLQVHLDRCPSCQHLLDTFSQVDESVGLLSGVPTERVKTINLVGSDRSVSNHKPPAKKRLAFSAWRLIPLAVAATILVCLGITMLPTPNPVTAEQVSPEEVVRPFKELHLINLQQQRDQELMLRTLGMDLRSLRLEIAQLETGSEEQENLKQQINAMIEKVKQFESQTQTNSE
jgi:hypothetical protein